jgi:hypothetical protein
MSVRIIVVLVAAAMAAFLFVKLRFLLSQQNGRPDRQQVEERRRRERVFRELEDRAPS